METRRAFLAGAMFVGVSSAAAKGLLRAHAPGQNPKPPRPDDRQTDSDAPALPNPEKAILESNDKDMKKKVDRLYQLATELKEEVGKTDSSKVFSLNLMKKAEEIEKLAHDIKNRAKG